MCLRELPSRTDALRVLGVRRLPRVDEKTCFPGRGLLLLGGMGPQA